MIAAWHGHDEVIMRRTTATRKSMQLEEQLPH